MKLKKINIYKTLNLENQNEEICDVYFNIDDSYSLRICYYENYITYNLFDYCLLSSLYYKVKYTEDLKNSNALKSIYYTLLKLEELSKED